MRILQINSYSYGSTGSIMNSVQQALLETGNESYIAWGRGRQAQSPREYKYASVADVYIHAGLSRVLGRAGFIGSKASTKRLIKYIDRINPEIVHIHNIHGYTLNMPVLFNYFKTANIRVVWTLHDCWSFTGHCGYFTTIGCSQWQRCCGAEQPCPKIRMSVPSYFFDTSSSEFLDKKELYSGLVNIHLVVPSTWLGGLLPESILAGFPVTVIPNGIDVGNFRPGVQLSQGENALNKGRAGQALRMRLGIADDEAMLLGVAHPWSQRKGLDDLVALQSILGDKGIKIVLVGLSRKQINDLPKGMIGLERTTSPSDLAEIYSASDIFLNLSQEESMGLTTVEAICCGTYALVYHSTALAEPLRQGLGSAVPPGDVDEVVKKVLDHLSSPTFDYDKLDDYRQYYSEARMAEDYMTLYREVIANNCKL